MAPLVLGSYRYDTTAALFDGSVTVPGHEVEMRDADVISDLFVRMARDREFDVSEFGLTFYLRLRERYGDDLPFVALPIFPNRVFRHSCVFVTRASGIERPEDLAGKRIGEFALYGQDSGVWAKGILADEYGFSPAQSSWVIGGLDRPMLPFDAIPQPHPDGVEITTESERSLNDLLEEGAIDALFTANVPRCVLDGSPRVHRLFDDFVPVERDWYRRTGIFPAMHLVVVRRDRLDADPDLARAVYDGFLAAKDAARERYLGSSRRVYQVPTMLPWANALVDDDVALMGTDWWPYGVGANRTMIDTYLRYHHEQGLSSGPRHAEDLFTPELLDT